MSQIKNINIEKYLSFINEERLKNNPIYLNKNEIRKILTP